MENMSKIEAAGIFFLILLVIVFLVDYLFIKRRYLRRVKKKKNKKNKELTEIVYLVSKFNLDKNKLPMPLLLFIISLINAFIISLVAVVVILSNTYVVLELLLGFILLFALIYAIYELLGRYLERRGYSKNGK